MISSDRLRALARENKVTVGLMEKDYVNSWILFAIYNSNLREKLIFKGGTALSKIYFPEIWRFSEDLDLTMPKEIDKTEFVKDLRSSLRTVSERSGINFEIRSTHFTPGYVQVKIQYKASLSQKNTTRLDITLDEIVLFDLNEKLHSFEDIPEFIIRVYSLEEIFVEKVRSLFERNRARDFFDVYKILETGTVEQIGKISEGLKEKMESKDINLNLEFSDSKIEDVESYWDVGLERFISTAEKPEFSIALNEIEKFLNSLKGSDGKFE